MYVRIVVSIHAEVVTTSLTCVTVGGEQSSVAVTDKTSGGGTAPLHPGIKSAGHVMTGGDVF